MFNLVIKKTIITRDVKFLKDQAWNNQVNQTNGNDHFPHAFEPMDTIG